MQGFAYIRHSKKKNILLMKLTCKHFRTRSRMSSLCWCWGRCRMVEMTERSAWILSSHSARIFNPYTDWFCLPSAGKVLSSPMYLHALFLPAGPTVPMPPPLVSASRLIVSIVSRMVFFPFPFPCFSFLPYPSLHLSLTITHASQDKHPMTSFTFL